MAKQQARKQPIEPVTPAGGGVRLPKAAEVVARALRRQIVGGELRDGDHLPNENEMINHFGVSRPTMREAVRVLEAERLVEARRGTRTGPQVRVPGPEIVARPAALLLEFSGVTLGDVMVARAAIEPESARLLALRGKQAACNELESILDDEVLVAGKAGLARSSARFHRRLVELSGNATLGMMAGMLHEIVEKHTTAALKQLRSVRDEDYQRMIRSYRRLIELARAGDADKAEAHWRRHMKSSQTQLLGGLKDTLVRDIID